TDDHKRQERFWKSAQASQKTDARSIRRALTEGDIDASDRRVRFVTLKTYEEAGGTVRRDLFTEGEYGIFITKPDLLELLVADRKLSIEPGHVRPEDIKAIKPDAKDAKPGKAKPAEKAGLSQALVTELTAHRTAAVAALLLDNPGVALSAIVHSLGMPVFYT